MKRFHVNVTVSDLHESINFYRTLFGEEPTVQKDDYAKWMLDDPRVNFSLSESCCSRGINHVGLQAETTAELGVIRERLHTAGAETFEQADAECCYARSSKTWVRDPDGVPWETFVTHGEIAHHGEDLSPAEAEGVAKASRCCA